MWKGLVDILVHSLAGFKHALPADLKYLECLSCYTVHAENKVDRQRAASEDRELEVVVEEAAKKNQKSGSEAITLSRKSPTTCVQQLVLHNTFATHVWPNACCIVKWHVSLKTQMMYV